MKTSFLIITAALLIIGIAPATHAGNAQERQFVWNEANAMVLSASTPEDFAQAAVAYRKLVDMGVKNGPLLYNLGTSLLAAGQDEQALAALLRSEAYSGSTWDSQRNIILALAGNAEEKTYALPWRRYPLFWHYALPCSTRITIATVAFASFWIALSMLILGLRRPARALMILSVIVLIIFGYSSATSYHREASALPILIESAHLQP
jgi:hypothetical protein